MSSIFWNQIREQLTAWYTEFSNVAIGQGIVTTKL